jgi:Transcription factor zinc-finger
MSGDPLNLIRLRPSKGETVIVTVPSLFGGAVFVFLPSSKWLHDYRRQFCGDFEGENMADDQNCFRCGQGYDSNQLTASHEGNRFCQSCWSKINARIETLRKCPVDGAEMKKRLVADAVVIDVCTKCGGLWFDKGELEIIEKKSREMGWQQGFFSSIMLM